MEEEGGGAGGCSSSICVGSSSSSSSNMISGIHNITNVILCLCSRLIYEGWNFNSGNYLFTTDTK